MIGNTISHYKILSKIGEGGRGIVYKAEDTELKRTVALKFISPHLAENTKELESLYREARSASQLNHPNITTIYEIGHSGKHNFIAMECMDGKTVKDKVKDEALSQNEILDIAIATLNGIKAAHDNNIIHRDIKSENIMVTQSGSVKVMDFGLAKNLDRQNVTRVSQTLGTIAYMAPEQIEGSKVDQRSDIYSFGIVLYEMVTGRLPFIGEHEAATLYSIVNEPAPDIIGINPNVDPNLIAIIDKAIEKTPDDRYNDVSELINDLNELKEGTFKRRLPKISWLSFLPKRLNRNWIIGGVAGIILLALASLVFFTMDDQSTTNYINSLAVLNFDNIQEPNDPNRLGQILQELIIADLSEIPNLKVFSSQRLFDIQKQLGSDNRNAIDPSLATSIAQEAGAQTMLTGSVIKRGNNMILTSQMINTNDGSILRSHQVEGSDIYTMVDELTLKIQNEMNLPKGAEQPIDVAVNDKTTSSVNAFQYYFNGIDYFNDSHFKEAIVEFNKAINIDSTFSNAYYKLALAQWWSQSEMDNETIENAQKSLQKVLNGSWYRTTKEKLLAQGALELTNQNFDEAENIYLQLINFISDEKEAWYGLGEAYFHGSQDFEKASDAFERAVELDPEFTIAYRHIFDIYKMNNEYDSGIIRATQLIENSPEEVWGHIFLGQMLIGRNDYEQAQIVFQDALQLDNELKIIYKHLAHVYRKQGNYSDGITLAQNMISSNTAIPQVYHLMAQMYIGQENIQMAIETYNTVLIDNPNSYEFLLHLAQTFQLNGDYEKAFDYYRIAERIHPEKWRLKGHYLLANIYFEQGRYQDAIDLMSGGLSDVPESDINTRANLLNNWAYFSYMLGDFNTALLKIEQVLSTDVHENNNFIAYLIRGFVLLEQKDINDLEIVSREINQLANEQNDNSFSKMLNNSIQLLTHFGKEEYNSVIDIFNNMDDREDFKYRFCYYTVIAYLEQGKYEEAIELINTMRKPNISLDDRAFTYPRSFYLEGLVNEAIGNSGQAIQNYQDLLNIWKEGDQGALDYIKVQNHLNRLR